MAEYKGNMIVEKGTYVGATLRPAQKNLLGHMQQPGNGGGWLIRDKIRAYPAALMSLFERGLIDVEWKDGAIVAAKITDKGRTQFPMEVPAQVLPKDTGKFMIEMAEEDHGQRG
jgi:hypothetical protein